jgi:hypothetical protein
VVWLIGDREKVTFVQGAPFQNLGVLEGVLEIPGYEARGAEPSPPPGQQQMRRFRPGMEPEVPRQLSQRQRDEEKPKKQTGPTREVKWLVAVEGDSPLKIVVSSQKGGTKVKDLSMN